MTVPETPRDYLHRPELIQRFGTLEGRHITVLKAPGGFGKTTLLAEVCRRQQARGTLAAWLMLTPDDTAAIVSAYLFYAFRRAGLDLPPLSDWARPEPPRIPAHRLSVLIRAIENWETPCLLVLDDAHLLTDPDAIQTLEFLLRYSPRNLHVAVSCRSNPGMDWGVGLLADQAASLGVEQLRFSKPQIAKFCGAGLSRKELKALAERTEGWPVALQLYRNLRARQALLNVKDLRGDTGIAANFLGTRLLGSLSSEDRDFLLDIALFDWIDAELVDEGLGLSGTRHRIAALTGLDGLLKPTIPGSNVLHIHPLLREYCVARRFRENPERYRSTQNRIARVLASRNHLILALRHAKDGEDELLVGEIIEQAGGLGLWFQEGLSRVRAIDKFVTPAVLQQYPRTGLLRCILLLRDGRVAEARELFEFVGSRTRDFTRDRDDGDDRRLHVERLLVQAMLMAYGCVPAGSSEGRSLLPEITSVADDDTVDPVLLGAYNLVLLGAGYQSAQFEFCRVRALNGKAYFARCGSQYGTMYYHFHAGVASMAQGRVHEAAEHYAHGRQLARKHFPEDVQAAFTGDALAAELYLERNRMKAVDQVAPDVSQLRRGTGGWIDLYAAAYDVAAEVARERGRVETTLAFLVEERERILSQGLPTVARYLSALHVSLLTTAGRTAEAAQAWRSFGLPEDLSATINQGGLPWRVMEAVALARVKLLAALGELDSARELADRLCETAASLGLVRTLMRSLVASLVVEQRSGHAARAVERLVEFLERARTTDYVRPLVRERAEGRAALHRLLKTARKADIREAADSLLKQLGKKKEPSLLTLTPREREVMDLLACGTRNRDIARKLGLTEGGVRFHLKNVYRKAGTSDRGEAVQRARALGLLS